MSPLLSPWINRVRATGGAALIGGALERYKLMWVGLVDGAATEEAVRAADPDLVLPLVAESHMTGTFQLPQAISAHWEALASDRQQHHRLHHISTDEVSCSLGAPGLFSQTTPYDVRSPHSASKAASDHLVNAWHHTYGLPVVLTSCSNNCEPWQFPEKLSPLYGDGANVSDWLYVEGHVEALLLVATLGRLGESSSVGGAGAQCSPRESTNRHVVETIGALIDQFGDVGAPHIPLINRTKDRPGHDRRYPIDVAKITAEMVWKLHHTCEHGLEATVRWYLSHLDWCQMVRDRAGLRGELIGMQAAVAAA